MPGIARGGKRSQDRDIRGAQSLLAGRGNLPDQAPPWWVNPYKCRAHSPGQSIPDNVGGGTVINLPAAQVDYDYSTMIAANTVTIKRDGFHAIKWAIRLAPAAAGRLQARLRVNGVDEEYVEVRFAAGDFPTAAGSDDRKMKGGDTLQLVAYQLTGGAQPIQVDPGYGSTFLAVHFMSSL